METSDFEVKLSQNSERNGLEVHWQPDPIVHPEYQAGGVLARPPGETHILRFDAGDAARKIRQDVSALLAQDDQLVPPALKPEGLVHLMELDVATIPRHRTAMLYALVVELAATAIQTGDVAIYEPGSAICLTPAVARELLDWRSLLEQLDNPLPIQSTGLVEDPDFAPPTEATHGTQARPSPRQEGSRPPGQQGPNWSGWLLAGVAGVGLISWYWLRG
ncbi:hypothetical protein B0B52_08520 [Polaromonas sp. A23]|nr:hypothetical protein B0B52_08520 [Polaromonas sp. A23]